MHLFSDHSPFLSTLLTLAQLADCTTIRNRGSFYFPLSPPILLMVEETDRSAALCMMHGFLFNLLSSVWRQKESAFLFERMVEKTNTNFTVAISLVIYFMIIPSSGCWVLHLL